MGRPVPTVPDPPSAAPMLMNLGFLSRSDLPNGPGPAYLIVALRQAPTLHHYDPEAVEYWVSESGRGVRRTLTRETLLPITVDFSWGLIRIVDRLKVTNEYLSFGGSLSAASVDGAAIAAFTSPAPILRRGGHSQGWDEGADRLGAFFSRLLLAVDYAPGFEASAAHADPITRYSAFVADAMERYRSNPALRAVQPSFWMMLRAEERRLRAQHPVGWAGGEALRNQAEW